MRRSPIPAFALSLLVIVVVGFGIAQHRAGGAPAGAQASPEPVELLDMVQVQPAGMPAQHVVLTHVTLAPGEGQGPHPHGGTSILYVESGTICFKMTDQFPGATVRVTAATSSATPTEDCEPPEATCEAGCDLDYGPGVLLTAGDSVAQGQTTWHEYDNVGTEPAVILISELQTDTGRDPCTGGCG